MSLHRVNRKGEVKRKERKEISALYFPLSSWNLSHPVKQGKPEFSQGRDSTHTPIRFFLKVIELKMFWGSFLK